MKDKLVLATRKSKLALAQSNWVKSCIQEVRPGVSVSLLEVTTKGDKILDVPLAKVGGKGLFVKEIEEAMLQGRADLAVHSLKDVPTEIPEGLEVSVFPRREDYRDAFISNKYEKIEDLPEGATIGTSSLRRMAQLRKVRPDLRIESLRGNLDTRLKKLDDGQFDAIILAAAGLNRLGLSARISSLIPVDVMLPAIGQGCLGIEFRTEDRETADILSSLHHDKTALCVNSERAFLERLQGGCQVPIGALANLSDDETLTLTGLVADEQGKRIIRQSLTGPASQGRELGMKLGDVILDAGGREILEEVYSEE
ncbi:MAG: hydroxymethylbilane synthase [Thermodesulfatator sp.]|nr:MAG: hydroxymethylbilane synthase [Thermodesulfatator sp.]